MSVENDGGPAFPVSVKHGDWSALGMTLRDHFAGLAMQGFCADSESSDLFASRKHVAESAYALADAMLVARTK